MAERSAVARRWWPRLAALAAGAALSLSFAPYDQWWLAIAMPALLMLLWARAAGPREGALLGLAFGIGVYAAGTWWLYIAIGEIGNAPFAVTFLVMGSLILIMAAYQALLGYLVCRYLKPATVAGRLLWMPAAWVLVEWLRGWFLSGFPWLSLGYSQTNTALAGLAPVGGVQLISMTLLVGAGALPLLWRGPAGVRALALVALVLPWTLGQWLRGIEWTAPGGEVRTVAIVQGAIPQSIKLESVANQQRILDTYARLHQQALGADLIVWPESALPNVANLYRDYLSSVWSAARNSGSDLVMGAMREELAPDSETSRYFNSMFALGRDDPAFYDKRHLVPFAEFFPVPSFVRSWLRLMDLPNGDFDRGAAEQQPFDLAGVKLAPSICYEDAYPALLRDEIRQSDALVTVTNDAWFGRSGARYQHLQIARMRALESRRYLVRAANDGVSAVIGPHGEVLAEAPQFEPAVLRARFEPRQGDTPYLLLGNYPVLCLALLVLAARAAQNRSRVKDSS